jgi:hypothetical protein
MRLNCSQIFAKSIGKAMIKTKSTSIIVSALALLPLFSAASAQETSPFSEFKQLNATQKTSKLNAFAAPTEPGGEFQQSKTIIAEARLTPDGEVMQEGLAWRIFGTIPGSEGKLPVIASFEGGVAQFHLKPGQYFVNVTFGRAGVTKKLVIPLIGEVEPQTLILDAGGFVLNAVAGGDIPIPEKQLKFSIYASESGDDSERRLVMSDVAPNTVVRLNAGTYHVVSEYGAINAVVRANIQVEAGKLTEATLQHSAAQVALKLVSDVGGEAIADTAWSVLTASGDIVNESVSAFSTLVLAEGEYSAVARNKEKLYTRAFKVESGKNVEVEVLMRDLADEELQSVN